ncbi:hypothetical protein ACI2KR_27100 [Pseudomonas luteola]
MATWIDLNTIETPDRIKRMKVDSRGYPIPYSVEIDANGKPDFRVIDPQKWFLAAQQKRCGICGEPLGAYVAFVGGPLSIENRYFTDLPMHKDCATYALQVCPFIAAPKFSYSHSHSEEVKVNEHVSTNRPEKFGLGITKRYSLVQTGQGDILIHANEFQSIEWWSFGKRI